MSMTVEVSKFLNIGWIINLLISGFTVNFLLNNNLKYLIFSITAVLPLLWFSLSLIF